MEAAIAPTAEALRPDRLSRSLDPFKRADTGRSLWELLVTAVPLALLWGAGWAAWIQGLWPVALLLTVPAAFFLVRLFLIQHDCGHGAFFPSRAANDWTGRVLSVLTLTPYACWKTAHDLHHATSGDLDRRNTGAGDIDTLTLEEYRALAPAKRFAYRMYRHPLVLFGFAPTFLYFLQQRLPVGLMKQGWRPWASALGNSVAVVALYAALIAWLGPWPVLAVSALSTALAATIGVWLFYVQHQFEETVWTRSPEWKKRGVAFHGSSFYDLPGPLPWLTAYIGVHNVHHLSSRIPFYRLPEVLKAHPEVRKHGRIGLRESFRYARLTLWDEASGRLISFREAARTA